MNAKSTNITKVPHRVAKETRWRANGHQGGVIWFTGLSGSGKTTLALELEQRLFKKGHQVYVLDGDNIRHGLSSDLGFSHEERTENIRRVGEVAALFADAGYIVISAFISPYRRDRRTARDAASDLFHTVHLDADLKTCEKRDPKGLYVKARRGEIPDFTGISAPYEKPQRADLTIDTGALSVAESMDILLAYVDRAFALPEEAAGMKTHLSDHRSRARL
ncbi:MAG TPA: adenylyl-sulfate kinase [Rhodospirillales bacterium]|jgi:bifunctional enzyme CysN/CysC|nr:adenylyl-sulfate kinase [Rhodospirillaceae bacterium]HJN23107.1 adenylyl-sulfate kinase [Rhodospirillales bacterium]